MSRVFKNLRTTVLAALLSTANANADYGLYNPNHPSTGRPGTVLSATTIRHCLVASFRGLDGEQRLDFFRTTGAAATLVHTRAFGNLFEDQSNFIPDAQLKAPQDLGSINGAIVWWSDLKVHATELSNECVPGTVRSFALANTLNSGFNRASVAEHLASKRNMLSDAALLDLIRQGISGLDLSDRQYQSGLFDFSNPAAPFLAGYGPQLGLPAEGINRSFGSLSGNSAIFALRGNDVIDIHRFVPALRPDHLQAVFLPRIAQIYATENLNLSLSSLRDRAVSVGLRSELLNSELPNSLLQAAGLDPSASLTIPIANLAAPRTKMKRVLASLRLNDRSTVQQAVKVLVDRSLGAFDNEQVAIALKSSFSKKISGLFFATPDLTPAELRVTLNTAMNADLQSLGLAKYLAQKIIAPLVPKTPILTASLRELLDGIATHPLGAAVDQALGTLDGVLPDDVIRRLFLNGPRCLNIPGSSRALLNLALVESGPRVDLDGIALFELIKILDYYFEGGDGARLLNELQSRIDKLHADLSGELAVEVSRGFNIAGDLTRPFHTMMGEEFSVQWNGAQVPQLVTDAILSYLESRGIRRTSQLKTTLIKAARTNKAWRRLPEKELLKRVTLAQVLTVMKFADSVELRSLVQGQFSADLLQITGVQESLDELISDLFPGLPVNTTLIDAVQHTLRTRIDPNLFASFIEETLGQALASMSTNSGGIPVAVKKAWRAAHGDCLAQWQVAFDTAALAAGSVQLPAVAAQFVAGEQLLATAIDAGVKFLVQRSLSELLIGVFSSSDGSYPRWFHGLDRVDHSIQASSLSGMKSKFTSIIPFRDRILILQRNNGVSLHDPSVDSAVAATMSSINGDAVKHLLGSWQTLSVADGEDGLVLVQGNRPEFSSQLLDIRSGALVVSDLSSRLPNGLARSNHIHALTGGVIVMQSEVSGLFVLSNDNTAQESFDG